jgi:hypothetical protein
MIEVHRATPSMVTALLGREVTFPVVWYVAMKDGERLAAWGLSWVDGKCWLEFSWEVIGAQCAIHVVRKAKLVLKQAVQLGETEVFALRDDREATSQRLLELLGFKMAGALGNKETWVWQR